MAMFRKASFLEPDHFPQDSRKRQCSTLLVNEHRDLSRGASAAVVGDCILAELTKWISQLRLAAMFFHHETQHLFATERHGKHFFNYGALAHIDISAL